MSFNITFIEGDFLIKLARRAIITFLDKEKEISAPEDTPVKLRERCGVFVTLNKILDEKKELRGCIGFPLPKFPIVDATIKAAISAAIHDYRFPRVKIEELTHIILEISILTPPMLIEVDDPMDYIKEVRIGIDGLIVERGRFKGLLLPQVPVEWHWDVEDFLANCCMKAGLSPDAWLIEGTQIYKFSCLIVREISPNGPVNLIDIKKDK